MERYLEKNIQQILTLIERLVNIDSGSYVKQGVDEVGNILSKYYQELGFEVNVIQQQEYGNHLVIQHKNANNPKIIILAHMDTVFPEGTVEERSFHYKDDHAYGPGVIDMKASLVTLYYAIKALMVAGHEGYKDIQIVLNSDEEIGSITSRPLIEKLAIGKRYALVMEPARRNGKLVSSRRGKGNFTLHVEGRAAHSGIEPEKGRSAIEALAHKIIQLHQLNDIKKGISVNVGLIEGGSSVNTISDHAVAQIDVRIREIDQVELMEEVLEKICTTTDVSGTKVTIEGEINRPPMEKTNKTEQLLHIIEEVGDSIGIDIDDTATGGGSDAAFTAALGIATIDGLGPVGGYPHSDKEYLEISSLVPRTLLLASIIQRLAER
ncbi:M20 family metallopeptidase [Radiobacillus sp. PE A8.2]|uniref:M20 family metallopeptidase n=1 Tax=Radiobacillus sp. PE A8.2 TaxID=3380349 RepID=UPI003890AE26